MARQRSNIERAARLTAAVTAAVTTLPVSTTDGWPDPGPGDEALGCLSYPDIDRIELFTYTGKTDDSFTGVTRGVDDTSPRAHAVRALVVHVASADDLSGVSTLAALDDVDVAGVADGDVLLYDTGTSTWGPGTASTVTFASALGFDPTGLAIVTGTDAQTAIEELDAAVDALTAASVDSGTYTPTVTDVANVATSITRDAVWTQINDIVTVYGQVYLDATSVAQVQVRIELPVASDLGTAPPLRGMVNGFDTAGLVESDSVNDEALLTWVPVDTASREVSYILIYQVA